MSTQVFSAKALDIKDPLAAKYSAFAMPEGIVYLDGNSLGPLPFAAQIRAQEVVKEQWGEGLITSWNKHHWISLPQRVGDRIGNLIGAKPGQVICCDSISVNLFKVLSAALAMQPSKKVIATTRDNFPTDIYMAQGLLDLLGDEYQLRFLDEKDIADNLTPDIGVLMLTQVNFRSGKKLDIRQITSLAHNQGILTVWDLAHSAGAFPVSLDEWQVDFAVGCTYKYLNGGPGAPAFLYVASRHQDSYQQPLWGWMGHSEPFEFKPDYRGQTGIKQNLCGTPSVIAMSVLEAALSVFDGVSMKAIDEKSKKLQAYFLALAKNAGLLEEFEVLSPKAEERGSQLALVHEDAYAICQAWIEQGVIADFRAPNVLRIGFAPLYLRFSDIETAVEKLESIVKQQTYKCAQFQNKQLVT